MVADTYSAILGFLDQGTGNNNNTWGDNCDISIFPVFEKAICGRATRSVTGGALDLSTSPPPAGPTAAMEFIQNFTGVLVSNEVVTVPALAKTWLITNNTTGAFALQFKTAAGTAVCVPQGSTKLLFCDGTNVKRVDQDKIGEIFFHGGTTAPAGAQECDGTALSRTGVGLDLFGKIGTTWGIGDNVTTFNVPDGKTLGKFIRSRTGSIAVGTVQTDQNKAHTHALTAASAAAGGDHNHGGTTGNAGAHTPSLNDPGHRHFVMSGSGGSCSAVQTNDTLAQSCCGGGDGSTNMCPTGSGADRGLSSLNTTGITANAVADHAHTISASGTHTHALSGITDGGTADGTEARPTNIVGMMCIWL